MPRITIIMSIIFIPSLVFGGCILLSKARGVKYVKNESINDINPIQPIMIPPKIILWMTYLDKVPATDNFGAMKSPNIKLITMNVNIVISNIIYSLRRILAMVDRMN
jgi:hypothetical protein